MATTPPPDEPPEVWRMRVTVRDSDRPFMGGTMTGQLDKVLRVLETEAAALIPLMYSETVPPVDWQILIWPLGGTRDKPAVDVWRSVVDGQATQ